MFERQRQGTVDVIRCAEALIEDHLDQLSGLLAACLETGQPRAVLDLHMVPLMDSSGLERLLDAREEFTPGWKFSEHEMRGVPLRIEIGPRDVAARQAVVVRRDTKTKEMVPWEALAARAPAMLIDIQDSLFREATRFLADNTRRAWTYEEF